MTDVEVTEVPEVGAEYPEEPVFDQQGSEHWYDPESGGMIINDTAVSADDIFQAAQDQLPEVAALVRWGNTLRPTSMGSNGRPNSILNRDRYVTPQAIFDQFRTALDAAENDDVVSGVLESTESLAFNKVSMSCDDDQEEDVWNQIIDNLEIDRHLREMWRETFIMSQFYVAVVWGRKTFKVKSKTKKGNKSKKSYDLQVPIGLTILDPLRVVPVGSTLFGQEKLAYLATKGEAASFDETLAGTNTSDQVVIQLIESKYEPTKDEAKFIKAITGATDLQHMYLLKSDNVFRHTATKPDYMRFANVRMKSVFEILDLKHQLRQMDRSYLIGGTNFILLVKKGSDNLPAKQSEINQLATQVKGTARMPVIVGDHRIEIEIVTPKLDMTLKPERYNTLDARITARLYQMFMTGNYAAGASGDDSIKLARVVARGMESRRWMIWKTLEKEVFKKIYEKNEELQDEAVMDFHPKRIALDFDANVAAFMQDLRDRGDISRETILSELDLDQTKEFRLREREKEMYDDAFQPTNVPFSGTAGGPPGAGAPATPKGAGRAGGGNANGGGQNPASTKTNPGPGQVPKSKTTAKPAAQASRLKEQIALDASKPRTRTVVVEVPVEAEGDE